AFAALKADGSITAWGFNSGGGTGAPAGTGFTQVFSTTNAFAALKADGSITAWGNSRFGGTGAPAGTGFTQIFSNTNVFAALKADGSITAWGNASFGGTGSPAGTGFTQIVSNQFAFAALKADGSITAWGDANYGGTGAPAGNFATVQSAIVSQPAFAAFPANSSLSTKTNQAYFVNLGAQGIGARYEITVGSLPAGLTLDATTGVVSGTATATGTYPFILSASTPEGTASQPFNLVVSPNSTPVFTSAANATFTVGASFSAFAVTATAQPSAITYTTTSALPRGMYLSSTGELGGVPASGTGGIYNLVINANNNVASTNQSFTLTVNQPPAFTSATSTPLYPLNTAASFTVAATGFPAPTYAITQGTLPQGLSFNSGTGVISGTPTAGGVTQLQVTATSGTATATQNLTIKTGALPTITSAASASFKSGKYGLTSIVAAGEPRPVLSLDSGTLPQGVTFDAGSGILSGTTNATPSDYPLVFKATNALGSVTQNFILTVAGNVSITSADKATGTKGNPFSHTVLATGASTPALALVSGALPAGVTFDPATGILAGTPTADGVYNLVFSATDNSGSAKQNFTLTLNSALAFTSANAYTASTGSPVSFNLAATGFPAPAFSVDPNTPLPTGLTLSAAGELTGTVALGTGGLFNIKFVASNDPNSIADDVTQNFALTINDKPQITSGGAITLSTTSPSTFRHLATGFPAPVWSLATGTTLPAGLSLDPTTGAINGTPASGSGGSYTRVINATNTAGVASQKVNITIIEPLTFTSANSYTVYAGTSGSFQVTTSGFPAPTFIATTNLPQGVTLSNSGLLTVPNTVGVGSHTIGILAASPFHVSFDIQQSFTLVVAPPVTIPSFTGISPDTGASATDQLTNNAAFTVSGTADANAAIKLYLGGALVGTTTANGSGNWSITPTGVAEGVNNFTATATDAANNVSLLSAVYAVTVDLTAPAGSTIVLPNALAGSPALGDTGAPGDLLTLDNKLTGLSGVAEADSTVEVFVDSELTARRATTAGSDGKWSIPDIGAALADGSRRITIRSTDKAGNAKSSTETYRIDTAAPVGTTIVSALGATPASAGYSRDTSVTVRGAAEALSKVAVKSGSTVLGTATADASGKWSMMVSGLSQGAQSLVAVATDAAGNDSAASSAAAFIVDSVAPVAPTLTSKTLVRVADGVLTGTGEASSNMTVTLGDGTSKTVLVGSTGWSLDLKANGVALAEGANNLNLVSTDAAGNFTTAIAIVSLDTTAPNLVFAPVAGDDKVRKSELTFNDTRLTGTVEALSTVMVSINGVPAKAATVTGTSWAYTLSAGELTALGFATTGVDFTVTATDAAGNTTTKSRVVRVSTLAGPGDATLLLADDTGARDNITSKQVVNVDVPVEAPLKAGNVLRVIDEGGKVLAETTLTSLDISTGYRRFTLGSVASPMPEGSYRLKGQSFDPDTGDTADSINALALVIDNRIPGAPSTPDLLAADDTGSSKSDNITSKTSLSFVVKLPGSLSPAVAGDKVRIYAQGVMNELVETPALTSQDITNGQVTVQVPAIAWNSLSSAQLYAQIITVTSVLGTPSNNLDIVVDTVAPTPTVAPTLLAADDTGTPGDALTSRENVSVQVSLAGTGAAIGDLLEISRGGTVIGSLVLASGDITAGTVTVKLDAALNQGANALTTRLTDLAGNPSLFSAAGTITLDSLAPDAPTIGLDAASNSGATTDLVTNFVRPAIIGLAEKGSVVRLFEGATPLGSATADPTTGAWSITP
ncbi:MAG: putative Ig domain-containing protein, partial [Acidobacteria bacterium]|nr:putative Ig domain-containing protein [Acidobacteriota bacterium]